MERNLNKCLLFAGMSASEIDNLLKNCHGERTFDKQDVILSQGEEYTMLYLITSGSVNATMYKSDGTSIRMHQVKAPDILAPMILFAERPFSPVEITAEERTTVLPIAKKDFTFMLQNNEKLLVNFIRLISDKGSFLINKMQSFAFNSIRNNIAQYLYNIYKKSGKITFIIEDSQQQLADTFSVTRPALANVIKDLTNEGIISSKGKLFTILDVEKLRKSAKN
ncbi:MAG: Crp/Fnr family transcriptional regulator [Bacteroidales bacterium]|nr:Crp/Fnr family transcriptional regulator [Bacteroidales bacterium]